MKPREMMFSHRYADAFAVYANEVKRTPNDGGTWAAYGNAAICIHKYSDALAAFHRANELQHPAMRADDPAPYEKDVGVVQWLMGDRLAAIETLRKAVDRIIDGTTKFADQAGGVSQGVLLWSAGVTAKDSAARAYALKYLGKLHLKTRIKYWPGPLASHAIGKMSFEDALDAATGAKDLKQAIQIAKEDLLKRRQLCQALFYRAVKQRELGDERACMEGMQECVNLENPVVELEWYLARGEVQSQ